MPTLQIRRLGYALGAEVTGVDLRSALDAEVVQDIRRAWIDHLLLCFPDQDITQDELLAFDKRVKRLLKRAKGFRGQRSKNLRTAKATLLRAGAFAYAHRRAKKRNMRSLWIIRIGAASREHGLSYSRFMAAVLKSKVQLDRKAIAELAALDPKAFARLVEKVKPNAAAA